MTPPPPLDQAWLLRLQDRTEHDACLLCSAKPAPILGVFEPNDEWTVHWHGPLPTEDGHVLFPYRICQRCSDSMTPEALGEAAERRLLQLHNQPTKGSA